jgi:hypothetical protein
MPHTKNVSAPGGGDDEDPRRPIRQVKGKTIHLEQQEGRKKRRMDRAARAAAATAAAAQAELGDQPQTSSDQIALRVHWLLDLPAFLLAAGADSKVHLTYLPGLLTLLTTSGRYVEEWVRVFYATVWIDPDHHWMRFRFEREDVTITASQIRQLFGFPESSIRLHSLCYSTSDPPRRPHGGVAPGTAHVAALFRPPFSDGSRRSPADFTTAAKYLFELIRWTLLPRMGYREATTHIQLWLLGALVSHSEFDVVDFLICEIEDTVLDGLRARRQLPYAHYLCHIFAQLIRPPQFQGTLEASRLVFGSYRSAPEAPVSASAPVFDSQAEDAALH